MNGGDDALLRGGVFLALLVLLATLEALVAGPNPAPRRARRWPGNAALVLLNTALVRLLLPAGAVGAALWAQRRGVGLFNVVAWPVGLEFTLALLLLDLAIYWQHRWLHTVSWLWPLHRVHHTDATLDVTSGVRFHPLEILLSLVWKLALAVALGLAPEAMLVFEILLSGFSLITHANLPLPPRPDRALRRVLVTPAMHRIHHSTRGDEQRRNYGFHLSVWDRLFGSYAAQARDHPQRFGVGGVAEGDTTRLPALLGEPFMRRR